MLAETLGLLFGASLLARSDFAVPGNLWTIQTGALKIFLFSSGEGVKVNLEFIVKVNVECSKFRSLSGFTQSSQPVPNPRESYRIQCCGTWSRYSDRPT